LPLVQDGQAVTLGMRRETVNISAQPASINGVQLQAQVEALEADFVHRTQTVQLRSGRWSYSGLCPLDIKLQVGQPVQAQINPEYLHFFDASSGLRL
jgi:ABC-type sugar transport system ATPase subunit